MIIMLCEKDYLQPALILLVTAFIYRPCVWCCGVVVHMYMFTCCYRLYDKKVAFSTNTDPNTNNANY